MRTTTTSEARTARFTVSTDDANAIVYTIACAARSIGEELLDAGVDSPGDLGSLRSACERLACLSDVANQLKWRTHHGIYDHPKDPLPVSASLSTVVDILALLDGQAHDAVRWPDDPCPIDLALFAPARNALAAVVAGQEVAA